MSLKQVKKNLANQAKQLNWPVEMKLWSDKVALYSKTDLKISSLLAGVSNFSQLAAAGVTIKKVDELGSRYQQLVAKSLGLSNLRSKADLLQQSKSKSDWAVIIPPRRKIEFVFENMVGFGGNLFFIIGSNSQVEIVEKEKAGGSCSVFVVAGKESRVDYFLAKQSSRHCYYQADLKQGSVVNFYSVIKPKDFLYLTIVISHWQNFSRGNIRSAFQAGGTSKSIVNLVNYHYGKHTTGDIIFRGVGRGKAWSRINGFIIIDKKAFVTDSYLQEDLLLLSDQVNVKAEPNLEILNNDVRASHGATLGTVDDNQLYYLRSRGLNKRQAEKIIEQGFLQSLANDIDSVLLKTNFVDQLK